MQPNEVTEASVDHKIRIRRRWTAEARPNDVLTVRLAIHKALDLTRKSIYRHGRFPVHGKIVQYRCIYNRGGPRKQG